MHALFKWHEALLNKTLSPTKTVVYNIFILIFLKENCCILIEISLQFTLKDSVDNESALVQAPNSQQAIIWTNFDLVDWCIYAPFGISEIKFGVLIRSPYGICLEENLIWLICKLSYA